MRFTTVKWKVSFNPRTREGATRHKATFFSVARVSIHAPVRVRPLDKDITWYLNVFQSTHP